MSSHILTNLLSTANMTIADGAELSEGVFKFPANTYCMIYHPLPVPTVGHKYYGRVDQKVPEGSTISDSRFEYYGGDGEGKNIVFTSFGAATQDEEWHTYSNILSFPYIAGENWTLRSFVVSSSQDVYRQKHMIIDLTESFGAGNEPSKDWCDRCIPFFEGTKTIESKPLVGVNGVSRPITGGYVGVNGVARKIIAGYIGVNSVAKRILGGIKIIIRPDIIVMPVTRTQQGSTNYFRSGFADDDGAEIHLPNVVGFPIGSFAHVENSVFYFGNKINFSFISKDELFMTESLIYGHAPKELHFEYSETDTVSFDSSLFVRGGSTKGTSVNNIYTDNSTIKNAVLSMIDEYTIVNVYHLDGSAW